MVEEEGAACAASWLAARPPAHSHVRCGREAAAAPRRGGLAGLEGVHCVLAKQGLLACWHGYSHQGGQGCLHCCFGQPSLPCRPCHAHPLLLSFRCHEHQCCDPRCWAAHLRDPACRLLCRCHHCRNCHCCLLVECWLRCW